METAIDRTTLGAAGAARDALARAARGVGRGDERVLAAAARTAIFHEALLGAIKARLAEFKGVAK